MKLLLFTIFQVMALLSFSQKLSPEKYYQLELKYKEQIDTAIYERYLSEGKAIPYQRIEELDKRISNIKLKKFSENNRKNKSSYINDEECMELSRVRGSAKFLKEFYIDGFQDVLDLIILNYPMCHDSYLKDLIYVEQFLTELQKQNFRSFLSANLQPGTECFYELITVYNLKSFKPYLYNKLGENFSFLEVERKLKGNIRSSDPFLEKLIIIATLANLGESDMEDKLLNVVLSAYDEKKIKNIELDVNYFFANVVKNSIRILNSKESILRTLVFLEDKTIAWSMARSYKLGYPTNGEKYWGNMKQKLNHYRVGNLQRGKLWSEEFKDEIITEIRKGKLWSKDLR